MCIRDSWYSDGQSRLIATVTGLPPKALTLYAEELQTAALKELPGLLAGPGSEPQVAVGGAIAEASRAIDSHLLIQTAEQALETALQRGRNRVKISQLT